MGEPTGNFGVLMNYMFRTQFDSLQVLRDVLGLKSWLAMKLPTDRPALVKMDPFQQSLTCENVRLKSFDDWPEIFETAVKNYEAGTDERINVHPSMWTGFVNWYTPALTITNALQPHGSTAKYHLRHTFFRAIIIFQNNRILQNEWHCFKGQGQDDGLSVNCICR